MERNEDRLLTVWPEAGKLLGMSRAHAYELANGVIPTVRLGRSVRVPAAALRAWIERNTTGGNTPAAA